MTSIVKIKVAIVLALGVLGYGFLGWRIMQPSEPGAAITFVAAGFNWNIIWVGIVLAVILSGLGTILGGSHGEYIGPLAVPAGLVALSIRSGGMERLLIENVESSRATMFYGMMGEVLFWCFLVALGFLVARIIRGMSISRSAEASGAPGEAPTWLAQMLHFGSENPAGIGNPSLPAEKRTGAKKPSSLSGSRLTGNHVLNGLMALGFCSLVTLLLLLVLMQSKTEPLSAVGGIQVGGPPPLKQIIFATGFAFFLGALASHQYFEVRLGWYLLSPILVSWLIYILGANKGVLPVDVPPQFMPKSVLFATVLPIQYVGIGMLTAIMGYWYSVEMHYHRRLRHTAS